MNANGAMVIPPPLSDETIQSYSDIAASQPAGPVRDAMHAMLECVKQWWELPVSPGDGTPHPCGRGRIVPLTDDIKAKLFDAIPWDHELHAIHALFSAMPDEPREAWELKRVAHHILYHVFELAKDREPITNDKL
jgi:hypothetical protein